MKKIVAVLVLCVLVVCGAAAEEKYFELNVGYGGLTTTVSNGSASIDTSFQGITFGYGTLNMSSKFIGFAADMSLERSSKCTITDSASGDSGSVSGSVNPNDVGIQLDSSFGLAIRPYGSNTMSLYIIPNVGIYFWFPPANSRASPSELLGFGVDASLKLNLVDGLGFSIGVDFDYFTIDLADYDTTPGIETTWTLLTPKVGLFFKL